MGGLMQHLIYLAIAAGVFIFTKIFAGLISANSIEVSGANLLEQVFVITFVIQWLAYIPAFLLKTEKFYDLTGSLTYLTVFTYTLIVTKSIETMDLGNLIVAGLIMIWAIRLGSFLFSRIAKDGEDKRFKTIRTSFSQFFMTWTLQGMWVFICSSAALVAITTPAGIILNNLFLMGFALFIFGFVFEIIADNQKSVFRSNPSNKDSFITKGLWARSRHPNYFGEITLWTGVTVMSLSSFVGLNFLALLSPIFTYILLNYISGVRMLEARGHKKWGEIETYQQYQKQTPKLIPKIFT